MTQLILHPTDISQWYALVSEAETIVQIALNDHVESYLVFLLQRFSHTSKLLDSVLAVDFLKSTQKNGAGQIAALRDVGDKSLLLSGLFPGIAQKRHVSLDYFYSIGQSAYLSVSELEEPSNSLVYTQLSEQFRQLVQLLAAIRNPKRTMQTSLH